MNKSLLRLILSFTLLVTPVAALAQGGPSFDDSSSSSYGGGKVTICYQDSTRNVTAQQAAKLFKLGATAGPCTAPGTLVITKTSLGGSDTFRFWSHIGNLADFKISTVNSTGSVTLSLASGTYDINEYAKQGWNLTTNGCASVVVTSAATTTCTIVNTAALGSISGTKFTDLNGKGRGFRSPLNRKAGVTIFLDTNNNGTLDSGEVSTVTNYLGNYKFSNLTPGLTYRVREVVPAGFTQTFPSTGVYTETLTPGQNATGDDFANYQPGRRHQWYDRFIQSDN